MNNARLAVAIQGLGQGERAWQAAIAYAHQRRQGRLPGGRESVAIVRHPDVARMLMTIRALVDGTRALVYFTAGTMDRARQLPPGNARNAAQALADLLTPIAKAWCTDRACEAADLGIQVHGGLGFIEQTGAAQIYRDARITPIYEGTNGIQAIDLLGRKLCRDEGGVVAGLCAEMRRSLTGLSVPAESAAARREAIEAVERLAACAGLLVKVNREDPLRALAGATNFLRLFGDVVAAWRLLVGAHGPQAPVPQDEATARREIARYFVSQIVPETLALEAQIRDATGNSPDMPASLGRN
jgi:hypothetical protein